MRVGLLVSHLSRLSLSRRRRRRSLSLSPFPFSILSIIILSPISSPLY